MKTFLIAACALLLFGCLGPPSAAEQFAALYNKDLALQKTNMTIKYTTIKTIMNGTPQQTEYQTMQYTNDKGWVRTDTSFSYLQSRMYILGDTTYKCDNYRNNTWDCIRMQSTPPDKNMTVEQAAAYYRPTTDGIMKVAGVDAQCFKTANMNGQKTNLYGQPAVDRYCYGKNGLLLYFKAAMSNTLMGESTAISFSTQVSDSDFELPTTSKNAGGG